MLIEELSCDGERGGVQDEAASAWNELVSGERVLTIHLSQLNSLSAKVPSPVRRRASRPRSPSAVWNAIDAVFVDMKAIDATLLRGKRSVGIAANVVLSPPRRKRQRATLDEASIQFEQLSVSEGEPACTALVVHAATAHSRAMPDTRHKAMRRAGWMDDTVACAVRQPAWCEEHELRALESMLGRACSTA
jgi:hypothetical protein